MSEDWDFYQLRVDDQSASIYCDIGIASEAPKPEYPYMAYLRLRMRMPRSDGLSSSEEYPVLVEIEDKIAAAVAGTDVIYVGRNTSSGCRDFYFYRSRPAGWEAQTEAIMSQFSEYQHETGVRHDPDWTSYLSFLYPKGESMERIQNRRVCDTLRRQGDLLVTARDISHWAFFKTVDSRRRFLIETKSLRFACEDTFERDDPTRRFGARIVRSDIPSLENIDEVVLPVYRAATECEGDYDGWETEVLKA